MFCSQHLESHSKSLFCWWRFNIQSKLLVSHKVRPKHFASLRHQLWHNRRNFHQFSVHFFCHIWFLTAIIDKYQIDTSHVEPMKSYQHGNAALKTTKTMLHLHNSEILCMMTGRYKKVAPVSGQLSGCLGCDLSTRVNL